MTPSPHPSAVDASNRKISISRSRGALLAALFLCPGLAAGEVQDINGELTASDFLATDSLSKTFYYDLYELTNPTASSVTVTLTIDAGTLLRPWASYWSTPLLPAPHWESPTDIYSAADATQSSGTQGDIITFTSFSLPAGATYQLAIATWDYNEDGAQLDTYLLSVDGTGVEVEAIPEPSSLPLQSTDIIALEGDGVPEGGGTFLSFNAPALNDAGQVAIRAFLTGTPGGTFDDRGIYRWSSATLSKIVRKNDPFEGDVIGDVNGRPVINNLGEIAIYAEAAAASDILLRSSADGLTLTEIARRGDTAPSGDGEFGFFDTVAINSSGTVAFHASLDNTTNTNEFEALYQSDGTTTTKIVRSAEVATVAGETLIIESLAFNDSGQVSFYADTFDGDVALYRGDGSSLTELYHNGDPVPDAGGGTFGFPSFPTMNESGDIVIGTSIDGVPASDSGVYRTANGSFEKIMREGDAAPVAPTTFNSYSDVPIINDSGDVAFFAGLNNTPNGIDDNTGIFAGDATTLVQVAREGDAVPEGTGRFWLFDDLYFNNHGQVVFESRLRLTANGNSNDEGLYFYDPVDGLMKIAREGDTLLGSTITFVSYASFDLASVNPEGTGLNDAGQVAYQFILADGRDGIALWSGPNRSAGLAAPAITSFASVGGDTWELTLRGAANTAYEFRSSPTLDFAPGTLVESLVQGNETSDPGVVTGGSQLTLDSNGDGKVRMTLTGPRHFVRAQTTPGP